MAVSCDQPSVTGQDVAAHLCIGRVCAWRQCRMQTVCCLVPSETQTCPSVCLVSQQRRGMTIRCLVESWRFKQQFSWTNNFRCALLHQRSNWLDRPTLHIFAPRDDYVFSMTRQLPALIQCMFPPPVECFSDHWSSRNPQDIGYSSYSNKKLYQRLKVSSRKVAQGYQSTTHRCLEPCTGMIRTVTECGTWSRLA